MLSPEQRQAFHAKLAGTEEQAQDQQGQADANQGAQEQKAEEQQAGQAEKPDDKAAAAAQQPRGPIPYDRFQEVVHKRKAADERVKQLEAELEGLRKQKPAESQAKSFLEELAEEEQGRGGRVPTELEQRLGVLESQLVQKEAATLLDRTIEQARAHYPGVPDRYFYAAIGEGREIEDGVELWEQTKREVLGGQSQTRQEPAQRTGRVAAPQLPGKAAPTGHRAPTTMDEAHAAFRRRMIAGA